MLFLFKLVWMKHENDIMQLPLTNAFYVHATKKNVVSRDPWVTWVKSPVSHMGHGQFE